MNWGSSLLPLEGKWHNSDDGEGISSMIATGTAPGRQEGYQLMRYAPQESVPTPEAAEATATTKLPARTGDFVLTHSSGWYGVLIRLGEAIRYRGQERVFAHWSHAAIFVDDEGNIVEALSGGVQKRNISVYHDTEYVVVHLPADTNSLDRQQAAAFANFCLHDAYGWLTIISLGLSLLTGARVGFGVDGQQICSALVARCLERIGEIFPEGEPWHLMPADLAKHFAVRLTGERGRVPRQDIGVLHASRPGQSPSEQPPPESAEVVKQGGSQEPQIEGTRVHRFSARGASLWKWLRIRENLSISLSVLAIVAVLIVPAIDKWLKADEELGIRINTLVDATNDIIALHQQSSIAPGRLDRADNAMLGARMHNQLNRATSIADSIKHRVYPPVLFALSNALIESGRYDDALRYLDEVLARTNPLKRLIWRADAPSADELAEAHVLKAYCYAEQSNSRGSKYRATEEMRHAIEQYGPADSDSRKGQLAVFYKDWADVDSKFDDKQSETNHRAQAYTIVRSMHRPNAQIQSMIASPDVSTSVVDPQDMPLDPSGRTYKLAFPSSPALMAIAVLVPSEEPDQISNGSLRVFENNAFVGEYEINQTVKTNGTLTEVRWMRVLSGTGGGRRPFDLIWTITSYKANHVEGSQLQLRLPPHRFIGDLIAMEKSDSGTHAAK